MLDDYPQNENKDDNPSNEPSLTGFSEASLARAPLAGPQQRFQSKAFTVSIAINPLIAATYPLLKIATHLHEPHSNPDIIHLHTDLCHEIKAFENKAHNLGYRSQVILAARYLLCATIDEFILSTPWGRDSNWKQQNLLLTFQRESWGGDRFFLILERSAEDPAVYLDLLELGYMCLSLGFQGKHQTSKQMHELATFIDNLYDVIRHQRGEVTQRLLVHSSKIKPLARSRWRVPPLWMTLIITLLILATIFLPYYMHLDKLTQNAKATLQNLTQSSTNE